MLWRDVAGRGLQPRPKRLKDEDMAVIIENGRDRGATPVPLAARIELGGSGLPACLFANAGHGDITGQVCHSF